MLGRSYALYSANIAYLASLGILGRFDSPGCRDICQSRVHVASRQPVSTAMPFLSRTISNSHVKATAQSESHRVPTPIKLWRKSVIMCPLIGNSDGRWCKANLPVLADCCVCPVSVPTVTLDAARSMLPTGASVAKYMSVAIESTTPLAFVGSARFRIV